MNLLLISYGQSHTWRTRLSVGRIWPFTSNRITLVLSSCEQSGKARDGLLQTNFPVEFPPPKITLKTQDPFSFEFVHGKLRRRAQKLWETKDYWNWQGRKKFSKTGHTAAAMTWIQFSRSDLKGPICIQKIKKKTLRRDWNWQGTGRMHQDFFEAESCGWKPETSKI